MSSKSSYHHGDLRNELILSGLRVLSREGVGGLSLRKVAKEAGVSHAAPYRHFADKDALLGAIAVEGFRALAASLRGVYEENEGDAEEMMVGAGVAYVKLAVARPETLHLMFGGTLPMEKVKEAYESRECEDEDDEPYAAYGALLRVVSHGVSMGKYVSVEEDALALLVWSCVHGLAMLLSGNQLKDGPETEEEVEALVRRICRLLLVGILRRDGGGDSGLEG